jgi:hypothetical protein
MSELDIKITVRQVLTELGAIPKHIKRTEVVKLYGRRAWENMIKTIEVFTDGKSQYVRRSDFDRFIDNYMFSKTKKA